MDVLENRAQLLRHVAAAIFDYCILEYMHNLHSYTCHHIVNLVIYSTENNLTEIAATNGRIDIIKYLISIGAFYPCLAVYFAIFANGIDILEYLRSININILNYSPLNYKCIVDYKMKKYLISIGAKEETFGRIIEPNYKCMLLTWIMSLSFCGLFTFGIIRGSRNTKLFLFSCLIGIGSIIRLFGAE